MKFCEIWVNIKYQYFSLKKISCSVILPNIFCFCFSTQNCLENKSTNSELLEIRGYADTDTARLEKQRILKYDD